MKMKKKLSMLVVYLWAANVLGQVGIGTENPITSSILDVTSTNKGVLIPRVALSSTDNVFPFTGTITNGTMIFNTSHSGTGNTSVIPGIYVWHDDTWIFPANIGTTSSKVVKFTNAPSAVNFNPSTVEAPIKIDIFGTQVLNDDSALFEKLDNYSLKINQPGLYMVSINLALKQDPAVDNSRLTNYIYLNLDGVLASSKIVTLVPQYDPSKVDIDGRFAFGSNSYFNAVAGQVLTLHSARYKNGTNYNGTVNYDDTSLSSITVIKIR